MTFYFFSLFQKKKVFVISQKHKFIGFLFLANLFISEN